MSSLSIILKALLRCGYMDIEFICDRLRDFEVDAGDVVDYHKDNFGASIDNANAFIYCMFSVALDNALKDDGITDDFDLDNFDTFCNCLDSHFYLKDNEGEWREIYGHDELVEFLHTNYPKTSKDVYRS